MENIHTCTHHDGGRKKGDLHCWTIPNINHQHIRKFIQIWQQLGHKIIIPKSKFTENCHNKKPKVITNYQLSWKQGSHLWSHNYVICLTTIFSIFHSNPLVEQQCQLPVCQSIQWLLCGEVVIWTLASFPDLPFHSRGGSGNETIWTHIRLNPIVQIKCKVQKAIPHLKCLKPTHYMYTAKLNNETWCALNHSHTGTTF